MSIMNRSYRGVSPSPTANDIMTTSLVYYDEEFKNDCLQFCRRRGIAWLPSLDCCSERFLLKDGAFVKTDYSSGMTIDAGTPVFHKSFLESFAAEPLLAVVEGESILGVLHFSDYNHHQISVYLYRLFHEYEVSLRSLLNEFGLANQDMGDLFKKKSGSNRYFDKRLEQFNKMESFLSESSPFQHFYINDLVLLANHRGIMQLSQDVVQLRNMTMHAHNFVNLNDVATNDLIFDFKSFSSFFNLAQCLIKDLMKVKNRMNIEKLNEGFKNLHD